MEVPCGTVNETYEQDMAIIRTRTQWFLLGLAIVLIALFPWFANSFLLGAAIFASIYAIGALGLNILTGATGQISLGHAAFVAVGAYTSAILTHDLGLSFWLALPAAGLVAGVVGILFGLPSLKVKGLYLVMATLAAQFAIIYLITHGGSLTRVTVGLPAPAPRIGNLVLRSDEGYFYLSVGILLVMTYMAKNIMRSRFGRAFVAIRDNDLAAEVMGTNLFYYKLVAFFIGCAYAGVAGSLWAHRFLVVTPEHFGLNESVWYLGMIVIGGLGSVVGSIAGAFAITFLTQYLSLLVSSLAGVFPNALVLIAPMRQVVFGLLVVLFLIFEPRGIAHRWERLKASYRLWPFSY